MKKEYIELTINSMCFFKFASISYLAKIKILITLRIYPKNLNMINLKKTVLASLFLVSNAFAQDGGLKGLLTDNASFGLSTGVFTYVAADSNFELAYGLNYSKQLNAVLALQGGIISGGLSNAKDTLSFNAISLKGLMNLTNLSIGNETDANVYFSAGINVMSFDEEGSAVIPNVGMGLRYALNNNIDIDLSSSIGTTPYSADDISTHMLFGLGVNYRFSSKDESVEWNNPLDAMYGDIANVKTEIEGLSKDSDGDGVSDAFDADNNTPEGVAVDGKGNALDVDMDGVADYADEDPFTARGVQVDAKGRELDSDKDGVANSVDMSLILHQALL